jgi:hypothetical protein
VPAQTVPETLPEEGASEDLEESVTEPAVSDSISTAQTISNGSTVNGYFKNMASLGGGAFNSEDYYRFTLSKRTVVTLWPTASGGNMSVQLLNSSETVLRPSTVTSSYLKITLDPGTYYIFVYNYSDNMSYSLTLEYCVHSSTSKTVINPTCTEEGYTRYTCYSCGISWNQDYVRASHTYIWTTIKEPTCTQKGRERGVCRYCSYRTEENITELGHNVSAWATTQEPTCAEAGIESGVCRRCNQTVN